MWEYVKSSILNPDKMKLKQTWKQGSLTYEMKASATRAYMFR